MEGTGLFPELRSVYAKNKLLDDAMKAGKFSAARRDHYARMYDQNPEAARKVIAKLQPSPVARK